MTLSQKIFTVRLVNSERPLQQRRQTVTSAVGLSMNRLVKTKLDWVKHCAGCSTESRLILPRLSMAEYLRTWDGYFRGGRGPGSGYNGNDFYFQQAQCAQYERASSEGCVIGAALSRVKPDLCLARQLRGHGEQNPREPEILAPDNIDEEPGNKDCPSCRLGSNKEGIEVVVCGAHRP